MYVTVIATTAYVFESEQDWNKCRWSKMILLCDCLTRQILRKAARFALRPWSSNVVASYFINDSAFFSLLSAGSVFQPVHLVTTVQTRNAVKNAHPIVKPVLEATVTSA